MLRKETHPTSPCAIAVNIDTFLQAYSIAPLDWSILQVILRDITQHNEKKAVNIDTFLQAYSIAPLGRCIQQVIFHLITQHNGKKAVNIDRLSTS